MAETDTGIWPGDAARDRHRLRKFEQRQHQPELLARKLYVVGERSGKRSRGHGSGEREWIDRNAESYGANLGDDAIRDRQGETHAGRGQREPRLLPFPHLLCMLTDSARKPKTTLQACSSALVFSHPFQI